MLLATRSTCTLEEYLERETTALEKSEFFNGEIFAMAGGTEEHALVAMNLGAALVVALEAKGSSCRVYNSDFRIATADHGLFTYPDVSVICGPTQKLPGAGDTCINPTALFEVLSDSTEAYDRGTKFQLYRTIPSLQLYGLVSQRSPLVEVLTRMNADTWQWSSFSGTEGAVVLPALEVELPLAAIYRHVTFPPAVKIMRSAADPKLES